MASEALRVPERLKKPIPLPGTTAEENVRVMQADGLLARADALEKLCRLAGTPEWGEFKVTADRLVDGLTDALIRQPDVVLAAEIRAWKGLLGMNESRLGEVKRLREQAAKMKGG